MLSFKNIKTILNEKLILTKKIDPKGKTIFIVTSDLKGREAVKNETINNREFIKSLRGIKWNAMLKRWETAPLDEAQAAEFTKETIKKLNQFNKEELSDYTIGEYTDADLDLKNRFNEFKENLKGGVMNVKNSKEYQEYIQFQKRFRQYSFNNTLLIFLQKRNATRVAGASTWRSLNRIIKKDEKALWIWGPLKAYDKKKKTDEEDIKIGEDPLKKVSSGEIKGFTFFPVFDISQTELMKGKEDKIPNEIKWYDDAPLDQRMRIIFDAVKQYATENNIKIDIKAEDELSGARGLSKGGTIELIGESLSTLIHEVAHEILHWKDRENMPERKIRELQAEGVANFVLSEFDIPAPHTEKYLAIWQIDPEHIDKNFNIIKDASEILINYINNYIEQKEANI